MSEWLDVIPWILGASAVTLGFLIFPGPAAPPMAVESEAPRGADVIDLAEFRQRRQRAGGMGRR